MADIYEQHAKAFDRVSAFVITRGGERVATIALKFPADGAGRLWAYVHWIGLPMARGFAGGYGYDKRSAAIAKAAQAAIADNADRRDNVTDSTRARAAFFKALAADGCSTWDIELQRAGFGVWQAV